MFTILIETGAEGEELHRTPRNKIDTEQRTVTITGTKGHGSATYKLKQKTNEMVKEYLAKNPQDYPFPDPKIHGEAWRRTRNRVADNLKQPELKNIPLKNLRNYSGATLYKSLPIRDPIAVMRHLRHKKLETTMHYIRAIVLDYEEDDQWTSRTSTTLADDQKLIETGFQYITERDGAKLFRKHK